VKTAEESQTKLNVIRTNSFIIFGCTISLKRTPFCSYLCHWSIR